MNSKFFKSLTIVTLIILMAAGNTFAQQGLGEEKRDPNDPIYSDSYNDETSIQNPAKAENADSVSSSSSSLSAPAAASSEQPSTPTNASSAETAATAPASTTPVASNESTAPAASTVTPTGDSTTSTAPATSPEEKEIIVSQVNIAGNQIISASTILNKVKTRVGDSIRQEVVSQDIKNLYGTGFFKDVKFDLVMEGTDKVKVNIVVEEKPIIKQIIIEGSSVFKSDALRKDLNLSEGQIFDPKVLQEGVNAIQAKYQNKGFRFVDVKSEVDVNPVAKEATIFILISEGDKFKIRDIKYEGVKAFKLGQIKKLVKTRKKEWFFSGVFKEEKFNEDLDRIQSFYQSQGYLDAKVDSHFDYDYKAKEIVLTVKIEEGQKYITGDVVIRGNNKFPTRDLQDVMAMKAGTPYSQHFLRKDIEALREFYFGQGYINVQIAPDIRMNKSTNRVDVTYDLAEGDLYYVQKVKIRGNRKTKDFVIRRELRIRPGEKLDGKKLEKSKQRLENLDYFETVDYEFEPSGTASNKEDVVWRVKEKQTGELSFGAGFSSVDSFVGFAQISQRNFDLGNFPSFVGAGQYASLRGRLGSKTRDVDFTFTEPYLFGNPYSLTVNIYHLDREAINTDFDTIRFGAGVTLGKQFSDAVRGSIGYTLEHVKLTNLETDVEAAGDASDVFKSKDGRFLSRLKLALSRDTRDNVNNPTKGWYLSAQMELVGGPLGGTDSFYSWFLNATRYWSFKNGHIIEFRNRLGVMSPIFDTDQIPVSERFYAGGLGTIRGYGYRNVGPRQLGDAVGGNTMAITNVEYSFPLFATFKGVIFLDAGGVGYDDYTLDSEDFAIGVGPGLKLKTPIGPIALYYGYPLMNPDPDNEHGRFEFSFSRGF
jgi:outer membrane protein insertion porin family